MSSTTNLKQDLQYATELARAAGAIAMDHFGKVRRLTKTHAMTTDEAVTEADRAAQRAIVAGLRQRFPDDGIIGEESDSGDGITHEAPRRGQRVWVIDPIDGTNNFVAAFPNFAVSIGLLDAGHPVVGLVYDVTRDDMYTAIKGGGCWLGDRQLHCAQTPMNDAAVLMMTSNCLKKDGTAPKYALRWMSQTAWKMRILGSAALEGTLVAAGVAHAAVTVQGKLWDCVAPAALVIEAGGVMTDLTGKQIFPFDLTGYNGAKVPYLAAAPKAHAQVLAEIMNHP